MSRPIDRTAGELVMYGLFAVASAATAAVRGLLYGQDATDWAAWGLVALIGLLVCVEAARRQVAHERGRP